MDTYNHIKSDTFRPLDFYNTTRYLNFWVKFYFKIMAILISWIHIFTKLGITSKLSHK